MTKVASCACLSASISIVGEPVYHSVCHCTNCRLRTGSAFGISTYFKRSDIQSQTGSTSVYALHNQHQDNDQERHFCPNCGTTLFWYVSSLPELIGVAGGCFGDQYLGEPQASYTNSKKLPWIELPSKWQKVDV